MKRLSLKTRLVLLHTGMMALVVCIVLALLFSISSREIVSNVENTLEASVFGAFEDMEYEDGRWDFDSDLMNLEDGVYLSVYGNRASRYKNEWHAYIPPHKPSVYPQILPGYVLPKPTPLSL